MTVMNAVSRTNHTEMPSTPRWYCEFRRSIHIAFSTNCNCALAASKPVHNGIVTSSPSRLPTRATVRITPALRSRPAARISAPKAIGIQIARLSQGVVVAMSVRLTGDAQRDEQRDQHQQTDDHAERVGIDVSGLDEARGARHPADQPRAAVHRNAVDEGDIAPLPEAGPQPPGAAGEHELVDAVEVVLVLEQAV